MFRALREHWPQARICALVNSYNVDVLKGNPDIDEVYAYTKAKHREPGKSVLGVYWHRLGLIRTLRRKRFDYAILAGAGFLPRALRLARMIRPRHIIGFIEGDGQAARQIDIGMPYTSLTEPLHEVQDVFRLLTPFGISGMPPQLRVVADPVEAERARSTLAALHGDSIQRTIGVHISARKVSQRWPAESFVRLIRVLYQRHAARFMLFWSPGEESNPLHPGDDAKAKEIITGLSGFPILPYPTQTLGQLIGGLSVCDCIICSDGGAMHIGAGLGKPILCFFGRSDLSRWHPWGVPYVALQPPSQQVTDIGVDEAAQSFDELMDRITAGTENQPA